MRKGSCSQQSSHTKQQAESYLRQRGDIVRVVRVQGLLLKAVVPPETSLQRPEPVVRLILLRDGRDRVRGHAHEDAVSPLQLLPLLPVETHPGGTSRVLRNAQLDLCVIRQDDRPVHTINSQTGAMYLKHVAMACAHASPRQLRCNVNETYGTWPWLAHMRHQCNYMMHGDLGITGVLCSATLQHSTHRYPRLCNICTLIEKHTDAIAHTSKWHTIHASGIGTDPIDFATQAHQNNGDNTKKYSTAMTDRQPHKHIP
jgi:hypothetical protein